MRNVITDEPRLGDGRADGAAGHLGAGVAPELDPVVVRLLVLLGEGVAPDQSQISMAVTRDHFSANHSSPDQCGSFGLAPAVVVAAAAVVGGRLQTQVVQVDRGCEEGQPEQVSTS